MSISQDVFCSIMVIAYRIKDYHPDWSMDKCIEQAIKGVYNSDVIEKKENRTSLCVEATEEIPK